MLSYCQNDSAVRAKTILRLLTLHNWTVLVTPTDTTTAAVPDGLRPCVGYRGRRSLWRAATKAPVLGVPVPG
jgi:hypothetical protein